jgi:hypothetical protein
LREDTIAIGTGGPILTSFQGDDYITGYPNLITGWRGLITVETFHAAVVLTSYTDLTVTGAHGGSGMACYVNDATPLAMSDWLNPFGFLEGGATIGLDAVDFTYSFVEGGTVVGGDMTFITPFVPPEWLLPPDGELSVGRLYVAQDAEGVWWHWSSVNGWIYGGPTRVPADLIGSTIHGFQLDVSPGADTVDFSNAVRTTCDAYEEVALPEYDPPTINVTTPVVATAATSTTVTMADLDVHDIAYLITAASVTVPTLTGWTVVLSRTVTGVTLQLWSRVVEDGDTWHQAASVVVPHPSGNVVGAMIGLADTNPFLRALTAASTDSVVDTATTLPENLFAGPHRASIGIVATAAASTQTWPDGWATTSSSGGTLGLTIATVDDWSDPPGTLALTDSGGAGHLMTMDDQTITLGTASRACAMHLVCTPQPFRRDPDWPADITVRDTTTETPWND